jgi:hypothetical protein
VVGVDRIQWDPSAWFARAGQAWGASARTPLGTYAWFARAEEACLCVFRWVNVGVFRKLFALDLHLGVAVALRL